MRTPRVVVITGATGGLGAALSRRYAAPGVTLGLFGRRTEALAALARQCRAAGAEAEDMVADVTDAEAMRRLLQDFDRRHPVDLLIASAGVTSGERPDGEPESWAALQRVFAVNLMGALNTLEPAIACMRRRRRGQIAVIGSVAARRGLPSSPAYCASKAAIETYAEALRGSLAAEGIAVSIVSPGYVASPMSDRVVGMKPFMVSAERAARIIRRGLVRRRARIAFPWPVAFWTSLTALVPARLGDQLVRLFSFQVRPEPDERPARPDGNLRDAG